ncbi:hypothetical protein ACE3MZ_01390 [Paenibacillus sp. WLX1005]|uniref:hypothetical protein n=1 Tax=Paenibacillus sp. WLX1005 TaxID=3243766 RepID=UPI00398438A1
MTGKKALWTTIGLGAAYLMRNKGARDKVISQVRNISNSLRQRSNATTSSSAHSPATGTTTTGTNNISPPAQ